MSKSSSVEDSDEDWKQEDHSEDTDSDVDDRRRPSAATKSKNRVTEQPKKKKIKEKKSRGTKKRSRSPEQSETGSGTETEASTVSKKKRTKSTKVKKDDEDEETPKTKSKSKKKKTTKSTKSKSTKTKSTTDKKKKKKSKTTKATGKPSKAVPKELLIAIPKRNAVLPASRHYRKGHNVYLFIESHFTGDIWHLAGALLLLRKAREDLKNPDPPLPLDGAELRIAIMYWGSINGSNVRSGKWLWEYIKSLGFPVVFVRYAKAKGEGRQRQASKRLRVDYKTFEDIYHEQKDYRVDQFDEAFTNYPTEYIVKSRTNALENEQMDEPAPQPVVLTTPDPFIAPLPGVPADPIIAVPVREWDFVEWTVPDTYSSRRLSRAFTEGPPDLSGDEDDEDDEDDSDEDDSDEDDSDDDEDDGNEDVDKTEGDERPEQFVKGSFFGEFVLLPRKPTVPISTTPVLLIPMDEVPVDEKPVEKIPTDKFLWPENIVAITIDQPADILPPPIEAELIIQTVKKVREKYQRAYVINFDLSTTILMQCMRALGFDASWPWLSRNLWHVPDRILPDGAMTNAQVEAEADKLITVLIARMNAASMKLQRDRNLNIPPPVVLFAWRESKYNAHTNTHKKHYDFIAKLAQDRTDNPPAIVVISMKREALKPSEAAGQPEVFNLYHPTPFVDRRIIACFWAKVAELQTPRGNRPLLYGLIGGRSGSLDIACYAGVNVIEWDSCLWGKVEGEPQLSSEKALGFKKKTTVSTQGPYNLRILNQQPMLWIVFMDNRHDDYPLVVPPSTKRTFGFEDVLAILESGRKPQEQVFPLEGRFLGDMPGIHLTRLGSSLKNLEASWLGIRLRYLDDYRAVFDKWKEEDEPDEGVGLDRAPKKKKSRKGLKAMTIDTEPEKTVSTTTITTHENPKSWPPMIPSVLPGVPIDVIRDDPPKTPKKEKKEKESTPREKKKRSSMKKKKDENDSD